MAIKFTDKYIVSGRNRVRVFYSAGPWVDGVDTTTIKIRPARSSYFPAWVKRAFAVENNSDGMTDYFEADAIRLVAGQKFHAEVRKVAGVSC